MGKQDHKTKLGEKLLKGIAASPGVAMGKVCLHKDIFSHIAITAIEDHQKGREGGCSKFERTNENRRGEPA